MEPIRGQLTGKDNAHFSDRLLAQRYSYSNKEPGYTLLFHSFTRPHRGLACPRFAVVEWFSKVLSIGFAFLRLRAYPKTSALPEEPIPSAARGNSNVHLSDRLLYRALHVPQSDKTFSETL